MSLTTKQALFVEAYCGVARGNASEAARIAGYAEKSCAMIGSTNLRKPKIAAAIDARMSEVESALSADEILTELSYLARYAERDSDKIRCLELLGKYRALWIERVDVRSVEYVVDMPEVSEAVSE